MVLAISGVDFVGRASDIRPDNGAVLFTRVPTAAGVSGAGYEITAAGATPTLVMPAPTSFVLYDGTGDRIFAAGPPARVTTRTNLATQQTLGFGNFNWFSGAVGPLRQSVAMASNGFVYLHNVATPDVALQLTTFAAAPLTTYFTPPLLPVGPTPAN